ncbi:DUF4019 domain-containing protein, partial [Myxococcota bacterium]|nr:DUF4019 domain-containing protein [Myxococcota bacterium]
MTEPPPAGLLLAAAIAALIGIVVWLAARGQGQDQALAAEVDQGVVADYCRRVGQGQYAEAWEQCLAEGYRAEVRQEAFVQAHQRRRAELGPLQGCTLLRADLSRNLFSRTRQLHLVYELRYPEAPERQRVAHEHLVAHDADGAWRIEGTYHET